jgi:hypothetical protein
MRNGKLATLALSAAAVGGILIAAPAANADAASTPVTFTLAAGSLSITAPSSTVTLTSSGALSVTGTSVSGQLGTTTVSDARGTVAHSVTVTMSASDFALSGGGGTIANTNATGYSGLATPTGVAVPVPTASGQALSGAGSTILTLTGVLGAGGATYNPTVSVAVPANALAGTYTGTVTQTVS